MTKPLTINESSLLQRYYDGDPLEPQDAAAVEELLNDSPPARVFMSALEEITIATQLAEDLVWERAQPPTAAALVDMALKAAALADTALEDLAPLLERFFDGEVVGEEMIAVQALINERDDVADYLANLDGIRASVRVGTEHLVDGVSFDGFWDAIAERLPAATAAAETSAVTFDGADHRVLLYRYHDDEVDTGERARVDAWLAAGDPEVVATLAALAEIRLATATAIETAQEKVDFSNLWPAIENAIDDQVEAQGENVVSFAREKRERKGVFGDNRLAAWTAIAAMLFVGFGAGLFKDQLFGGPERVIVEKTVVIVDSVEYEPGSSVMVNTPMRPVSSISSADDTTDEAEPTVIWLLEQPEAAPADDGAQDAESEGQTDDSEEEPSDQPI